MDGATRP